MASLIVRLIFKILKKAQGEKRLRNSSTDSEKRQRFWDILDTIQVQGRDSAERERLQLTTNAASIVSSSQVALDGAAGSA
eukprot:CAMPEP_0171513930 /NCGR_PEP_ID=MMETSP0959-20130129/2538_1 /TAXON_ID=87120 /ORGANISM="Aurantiochytrium limacinum, Strain ATCCMYA-1381" /LENGTH=79 /DNA_ID=CAMNT_0012052151 /DNA_START=398 /DNA_END=634 /DNA_ORIENTATION=-